MSKFFNKKLNTILALAMVSVSVIITMSVVINGSAVSEGVSSNEPKESIAHTNPINSATPDTVIVQKATEVTEPQTTEPETQKPSEKKNKKKTDKKSEKKTEKKTEPTTTEAVIEFATALPTQQPANYQAQWDAGYLVAIDNPDETYKCGKVTLSDYDRDLLERLCMGEFGSGGFVGASLIAQSVKNAICFDGFTSVQQVIDECQYTGRTDIEATEACKEAVRYIFDENHDAVQHRLMYMYNPLLVASAFHESQNYILTYEDVRFFDRWGY